MDRPYIRHVGRVGASEHICRRLQRGALERLRHVAEIRFATNVDRHLHGYEYSDSARGLQILPLSGISGLCALHIVVASHVRGGTYYQRCPLVDTDRSVQHAAGGVRQDDHGFGAG